MINDIKIDQIINLIAKLNISHSGNSNIDVSCVMNQHVSRNFDYGTQYRQSDVNVSAHNSANHISLHDIIMPVLEDINQKNVLGKEKCVIYGEKNHPNEAGTCKRGLLNY